MKKDLLREAAQKILENEYRSLAQLEIAHIRFCSKDTSLFPGDAKESKHVKREFLKNRANTMKEEIGKTKKTIKAVEDYIESLEPKAKVKSKTK